MFTFESNRLSSGIMQSPHGCSRIVLMKRGCAFAKIFSVFLFLNFLDPSLITALGNLITS